ncbi:MAG: hypothetical protein ACRDF0_00360 [Candidatus Limnocylindria bacterium]
MGKRIGEAGSPDEAAGRGQGGTLEAVKEWIVCEDNCLKCSYGATLDCDGDCPRCPRNTYCPCVTFISFAAGKLAPVAQPVATSFERPRAKR